MSQFPDLRKIFEVTYVPPASGEATGTPGKSLSVHHVMRYARDCHKQLLNHLSNENLLDGTGESSVVESETKTVIECTGSVIEKSAPYPSSNTSPKPPRPAFINRSTGGNLFKNLVHRLHHAVEMRVGNVMRAGVDKVFDGMHAPGDPDRMRL